MRPKTLTHDKQTCLYLQYIRPECFAGLFAGSAEHTEICCVTQLRLISWLFVKMKCYTTALPNVPIEISPLSPLDTGSAAEIKRLQSMWLTLDQAGRLHSGELSLWGAVEGQQGVTDIKTVNENIQICFLLSYASVVQVLQPGLYNDF